MWDFWVILLSLVGATVSHSPRSAYGHVCVAHVQATRTLEGSKSSRTSCRTTVSFSVLPRRLVAGTWVTTEVRVRRSGRPVSRARVFVSWQISGKRVGCSDATGSTGTGSCSVRIKEVPNRVVASLQIGVGDSRTLYRVVRRFSVYPRVAKSTVTWTVPRVVAGLGTLLTLLFTAWMVLSTRRLANLAREDNDVATQPFFLVSKTPGNTPTRFGLAMLNFGNGPGLNVRFCSAAAAPDGISEILFTTESFEAPPLGSAQQVAMRRSRDAVEEQWIAAVLSDIPPDTPRPLKGNRGVDRYALVCEDQFNQLYRFQLRSNKATPEIWRIGDPDVPWIHWPPRTTDNLGET